MSISAVTQTLSHSMLVPGSIVQMLYSVRQHSFGFCFASLPGLGKCVFSLLISFRGVNLSASSYVTMSKRVLVSHMDHVGWPNHGGAGPLRSSPDHDSENRLGTDGIIAVDVRLSKLFAHLASSGGAMVAVMVSGFVVKSHGFSLSARSMSHVVTHRLAVQVAWACGSLG